MVSWLLPATLAVMALASRRHGDRPENVALMLAGWLLITLANQGVGNPVDVRTAELAVSGGALGGVLYTCGALRQGGGRWRSRRPDEDE